MKTASLFFLSLLVVLCPPCALSKNKESNCKLAYWNEQRKGANGDGGANKGGGTTPDAYFKAAAEAKLDFVRLIPQLWPGEGRDFLLGNADEFRGIPDKDMALLKSVLDTAHKYDIKILLTMFSLPGARNRQDNNYEFDYRLWNEEKYQLQAQAFWQALAAELKNHPAIVGYNPLNEPHPERQYTAQEAGPEFEAWLKSIEGTTADLNRFNRKIVKAIRHSDKHTPVVLDGWMHASIDGLLYLKPVEDDAVIYAFHTYGVWEYATFRINKGRFSYPDAMPAQSGAAGETVRWSRDYIDTVNRRVDEWARRHRIPAKRMIAEEFGADRRVGGVKLFLQDTIYSLNKHHWHWAFYSFRPSNWDGLDYELGTKKLGWAYWRGRENGKSHEQLIKRADNPLWAIFEREFLANEEHTPCGG